MSEDDFPRIPRGPGRGGQPPPPPRKLPNLGLAGKAVVLALLLAVGYGIYFWEVRRVVVGQGQALVLMKKYGSRSLEGDQVIIPAPPAKPAAGDAQAMARWQADHAQWEKQWGDVNGILEQVYIEGTYFGFSPFDYERRVLNLDQVRANIPNGKVGVVVRKFGTPLRPGQVLAEDGQRGPLPVLLPPGRYPQYANPWAYDIKLVDPVQIEPGHRGVVTLMAAQAADRPNEYLVGEGERGVQPRTEPEGFRYINPFEKRVTPISIRSQRFEMSGADVIRFPSSDSFDIQLEGFVEWTVIPEKLPLVYVQYSEGNLLIERLEETVILPYARSFCRLVGSQYNARDFISGDTKIKFQNEFEARLREACKRQGIEILQALVRDIVPPAAIKNPINEREIAKQQIRSLEQQIQVAASAAELAKQEQMATQNQKIGEANKQVVTILKKAEQERDVALTRARQELAVAKLALETAKKEAGAMLERGKAEADVVLLQKQAEAEPLRRQVEAFGDGQAYAQYFFYQKVAPSVRTILTNTDGPFADLFKQFMVNKPASGSGQTKVTEVRP